MSNSLQNLRDSKRAFGVMIFGFISSLLSFFIVYALSQYSPNYSLYSACLISLLTLVSWTFPLFQGFLQKGVYLEAHEIQILKTGEQKALLFEQEELGEHGIASRYQNFSRLGIPLFSVGLIAIVIWMFQSFYPFNAPLGEPSQKMIISSMIILLLTFFTFLFSKYCSGLFQLKPYSLLKSPVGLMMASTGIYLLSAFSCWFQFYEINNIDTWFSNFSFAVLALFGVETTLHLVTYFYHPKKNKISPPYESRLFNLMTSSSFFLTSFSETFKYQFGVEFSKKWIFGQMEKWVCPIILAQFFIFTVLSCFILVAPNERAFIERFGKRTTEVALESGLHFKYPWPIDSVRRIDVTRIRELVLGVEGEKNEIRLYTKKHAHQEYNMIVASNEQNDSGSIPVNLVVASYAIQYSVHPDHILKYAYQHVNSSAALKNLAEREHSRLLNSVDLMELMTTKREELSKQLEKKLQKHALNLGIKIHLARFVMIHPPVEVSPAFEDVVKASENKETQILKAQSVQNQIQKETLYQSQVILNEAKAQQNETIQRAKGDTLRFKAMLDSYNNSKSIFKQKQYLGVLEDTLQNQQKIIIPDHLKRVQILNLEDKLNSDILDLNPLAQNQKGVS